MTKVDHQTRSHPSNGRRRRFCGWPLWSFSLPFPLTRFRLAAFQSVRLRLTVCREQAPAMKGKKRTLSSSVIAVHHATIESASLERRRWREKRYPLTQASLSEMSHWTGSTVASNGFAHQNCAQVEVRIRCETEKRDTDGGEVRLACGLAAIFVPSTCTDRGRLA